MTRHSVRSSVLLAAVTLAAFLGLISWGAAQASSSTPAITAVLAPPLQQGAPMTGTVPGGAPMQHSGPLTDTEHAGHNMPAGAPAAADEHAGHALPAEAGAGRAGMADMGAMMAKMAEMQGMMARMQRMMASDMMGGDMPMSADMQQRMSEMMGMMGEMQGMMADMQGMLAGGMMAGDAPGGMSGMGQSQGGGMMQGMDMGKMMGQMPMMGTVIMVMPMPMHGGMMQGMDMGKMMGQMPMMQGGMEMGGMMGGQGGAQGAGPAAGQAAAAGQPANAAAAPQTAALGDIEVKVTPPDLSNIQGETIDFTVDLNATGADLSFDLAKQATLLIGDHKMPAEAWEVTLDHGHHVAGVLTFPAHMQGKVAGATVVFTDPAGGPEASVSWTTAE
jgi:hypothetical protein